MFRKGGVLSNDYIWTFDAPLCNVYIPKSIPKYGDKCIDIDTFWIQPNFSKPEFCNKSRTLEGNNSHALEGNNSRTLEGNNSHTVEDQFFACDISVFSLL